MKRRRASPRSADGTADPDPEGAGLGQHRLGSFTRGARNRHPLRPRAGGAHLITARLVQRLDITAPPATTPRPVGMVVNRRDDGAPMNIRARTCRPESAEASEDLGKGTGLR